MQNRKFIHLSSASAEKNCFFNHRSMSLKVSSIFSLLLFLLSGNICSQDDKASSITSGPASGSLVIAGGGQAVGHDHNTFHRDGGRSGSTHSACPHG
jgi:hypothetical protein